MHIACNIKIAPKGKNSQSNDELVILVYLFISNRICYQLSNMQFLMYDDNMIIVKDDVS